MQNSTRNMVKKLGKIEKEKILLVISEKEIEEIISEIYDEFQKLKKEGLQPKYIFQKYTTNFEMIIEKLFQKLNIQNTQINRNQAMRIFEIIIFALLKSSTYQELVEDLMDFTGLTKAPIQAYIRKYLNILRDLTGVNIEKWSPELIYGVEKYIIEDVRWWITLYEKLGSYNHVKDHIRKVNGQGPADTTIKERITQLFIDEGKNFKKWEKRFKRNIRLQKYRDDEEIYWIKLYEELGSFYLVALCLQEDYGKVIRSSAIKERIEKKFLREYRTDFDDWVKTYKRENPTTIKPVYPHSHVELWIRLFEKYGFISDVIKEYEIRTGTQVSQSTILYRIVKLFEEEGKDFDKWYEMYRKSTKYGGKKYNKEDIEEWERLFEEIGSFSGVSYYLSEILGREAPLGKSIKKHLKEKFLEGGSDFKKWVIEFYSPNHERANNIGFFIHYIMEYLFLINQLRKGKKVFYEISPTEERDTVIDNAVINLGNRIKMTCIDYSTSRHKHNLFDKMYKQYQSIDRELIIVSLLIDEDIKIAQNIRRELKRNVKILNKDSFARWAGYKNEDLKYYNRIIELAKIALYDDDAYNELRSFSKEAQLRIYNLSKKYPISEGDLLKYLNSGTSKDYTYVLKGLKFKDITDFTGL